MTRPTGLKSYDKRTKKAIFECVVPGTQSRSRKRKVVTVDGWDDLLHQLTTFRAAVQHPEDAVVLPGDVPTIRTYLTTCWDAFSGRLSPKKRGNHHALLELHVLPFLGNVRLDRVTTAHLEDFVRVMQRKTYGAAQRPYSNSTINTALHLVRSILKHAWRRRVINDYPLREKLPLLHEPVVQNELTVEERDTFLASFDNDTGFRAHFTTTALAKRADRKHQPPHAQSAFVTEAFERLQWSKPLFVLALYTGLRRSDLRLLRWESVDLTAGVIRLIMRKTKRPVLLPIVPKVRAALDTCRKRTVMSEYVLLTPEGRPYSESTIKRYFTTAKAVAGITRRFRFHDQRHTFASTLASKGINSFTLGDLLGHTSTRTTERYVRPSAETLDAVRRALA
ncbi:MAG TPA: tyrosine-type recombinase/integrase [Thermoanaerobaculia bacterium]|jgi:integrase|nr:tyrosine-type recombinase/integrase [Thermoanaerobaculia bacterium]